MIKVLLNSLKMPIWGFQNSRPRTILLVLKLKMAPKIYCTSINYAISSK